MEARRPVRNADHRGEFAMKMSGLWRHGGHHWRTVHIGDVENVFGGGEKENITKLL